MEIWQFLHGSGWATYEYRGNNNLGLPTGFAVVADPESIRAPQEKVAISCITSTGMAYNSTQSPTTMESTGYLPIGTQNQAMGNGIIPVHPSFSQRPMYVQPWGTQLLYPGASPQMVGGGNPLQFLFSGFPHPQAQQQQHPHGQQLQHPLLQEQQHPGLILQHPPGLQQQPHATMQQRSYPFMQQPQHQPMQHLQNLSSAICLTSKSQPRTLHAEDGVGGVGAVGQSNPRQTSTSTVVASTFSQNSSSGQTGRSTSMTEAHAFTSPARTLNLTIGQGEVVLPYVFPNGSPCCLGGEATQVAMFSNGTANLGSLCPPESLHAAETAGNDVVPASNLCDNRVVEWEESRRTRQRRLQRQAKTSFKAKSSEWPMTITCTPTGGIDKDHRLFVHRMFRASARRFLNLGTISFRDHPDTDIMHVCEDLSKRFIFDPPLREGYILWYIEESLRTSRYQWRKHWNATGRGEKHKLCPSQFFPALVKHWCTLKSEEESKRMKQARAAARNAKKLLLTSGKAASSGSEDTWDPMTDKETPEYLTWDEVESALEPSACANPSDQSIANLEAQLEVGTSMTPPPNELLVWAAPQENGLSAGSPACVTTSSDPKNIVRGAQRALGRQLHAVKSTLGTMSDWREGVDKQLASNAADMSSLSKKLDLLLELQLGKVTVGSQVSGPQVRNSFSVQEGSKQASEAVLVHGEGEENTGTTVGIDKTCSASAHSQEMCRLDYDPAIIDEGGNSEWITDVADVVASKKGSKIVVSVQPSVQEAASAAEIAFGAVGDDLLKTQKRQDSKKGVQRDCVEFQVSPAPKKARVQGKEVANAQPTLGAIVEVSLAAQKDPKVAGKSRPPRKTRKPSKYRQHTPPVVNKPRSDKNPLPPNKVVWVLHPDHPDETIAIGCTGPHWRSQKKKLVPHVEGVSWECGMQQVAIDHVYPQWAKAKVMYPDKQRKGITVIADALQGDYAEDSTVLWGTTYLLFISLAKA